MNEKEEENEKGKERKEKEKQEEQYFSSLLHCDVILSHDDVINPTYLSSKRNYAAYFYFYFFVLIFSHFHELPCPVRKVACRDTNIVTNLKRN